jgi:hypothetical protein
MRAFRTVLAAFALLTAVLPVLLAGPARGAGVHGDDEQDQYVGSGGLLLPGGVSANTRREVASCLGCSWRLSSPCVQAPGVGFDDQPTCAGVVRGCPGGRLLRGWFRPADGSWRELGLVCLGPRGPITVADVSRAIAESVPHRLPLLRPRGEPNRGVLAQLPVHFRSGQQPGPLEWADEILGQQVSITARPSWTWSFGDGAALVTSDPGGRYPHGGVVHTYGTPGVMTVTCSAEWRAQFEVDGLGPFPVPEVVHQRAEVEVAVGEGRGVLTLGHVAQ